MSFLEPSGAENAGDRNPITGGENRKWTDRLRDVEEAVDLPGVSERVKQIREDLSKLQREFIRHGREPEWDLVEMQMMEPIHELRRQLAEELAKIKSDKALVPIDRDPVPDEFEELVRRYYLRLGKGE